MIATTTPKDMHTLILRILSYKEKFSTDVIKDKDLEIRWPNLIM